MRALVTGAAGFVGRHLINFLTDETELEIVGTTYRRQPKPDFATDRVHLERLDLREPSAVAEVLARWHPEYIFHLAGQSSVPLSWEHPWPTFEQNVHSQINVFHGVLAAKLASRILVVGSGEEYGAVKPADIPIDEETPLRPLSPYGISKVAQDLLGLQYHRSHQLHVIRVRPFNHIGPGQNEMFVTSSFAKQIAKIEAGRQEPLLRHGNLDAIRDFTDVRDMVQAYWLILNAGELGAVYNAGSGRPVRIGEVLDMFIRMAHVDISVEPDPNRMRPSDLPIFVCNPTRLQNTTAWKPQIELEQTLQNILDDWRQRIR